MNNLILCQFKLGDCRRRRAEGVTFSKRSSDGNSRKPICIAGKKYYLGVTYSGKNTIFCNFNFETINLDMYNIQQILLQLRYLQTLNNIAAEKNSTIVFPMPMSIFSHLSK